MRRCGVSKFKSLAAVLDGHYGKPERARLRRAFAALYTWDVPSSDLEQDRTWPLIVEIGDIKAEISEVEAMPATNHGERGKRKADLAELREELAHKELALEELIREELARLEAQTRGTTTPAGPPVELAPVVTMPIVRAELGRPRTIKARVQDYIARTYPDGTAANIPDLRRELEAKKIYASATTIERALGRRRDSDRSSKSRPK
jgi:hypothetical protein